MKIVHLISSNGLFGAENVMLKLASNMNYNGMESLVMAIINSHNPHSEVIEAAKKKNIPVFTLESRGRFELGAVYRLTDFIKKHKIDVLHTHNYKANFIGLLAAKKAKIPVVATLHGYIGSDSKLKFYEGLDRFILRYFDKVILVDDSLRQWLKNGLVKYQIINNGVDTKEAFINPQTHNPTDPQTKLTIGTAGRLSEEKGYKYLLEAFAKIVNDYPNAQLLIVGEGELRDDLEIRVKNLGLQQNVIFAGYQKDMDKVYRVIDIVVQPSLREGLPMTLLEAMSFGKAIIATDVGGTSHLIKDMFTGLLIKPAQSSEIETALLKLVKDSSLREILGENAKQFVKENYSLEKMVDLYRNVYEEVLRP